MMHLTRYAVLIIKLSCSRKSNSQPKIMYLHADFRRYIHVPRPWAAFSKNHGSCVAKVTNKNQPRLISTTGKQTGVYVTLWVIVRCILYQHRSSSITDTIIDIIIYIYAEGQEIPFAFTPLLCQITKATQENVTGDMCGCTMQITILSDRFSCFLSSRWPKWHDAW